MCVPQSQRGFALIVAIVLIVVGAILASTMAFMVATSGSSAGDNMQSAQALFLVESGLEYEQRQLAQNVDWYRTTSDPFDNATNSFGPGAFTVSANIPGTELTRQLTTAQTTINVFAASGARWTAPGGAAVTRLLVVNNTFDFGTSGGYRDPGGPGINTLEFMAYNTGAGWTATSFAVTRNQTINGVNGTGAAGAFGRGDYVYPVAQLGVALSNTSCTTIPNPFTINNDNGKFLASGTLTVFHQTTSGTPQTMTAEQIFYANSSVSGTTRTLLGVQRCWNGTSAITASINDPVAPVVFGVGPGASAYDLEVAAVATGNVSNAQRQSYRVLQR